METIRVTDEKGYCGVIVEHPGSESIAGGWYWSCLNACESDDQPFSERSVAEGALVLHVNSAACEPLHAETL